MTLSEKPTSPLPHLFFATNFPQGLFFFLQLTLYFSLEMVLEDILEKFYCYFLCKDVNVQFYFEIMQIKDVSYFHFKYLFTDSIPTF